MGRIVSIITKPDELARTLSEAAEIFTHLAGDLEPPENPDDARACIGLSTLFIKIGYWRQAATFVVAGSWKQNRMSAEDQNKSASCVIAITDNILRRKTGE